MIELKIGEKKGSYFKVFADGNFLGLFSKNSIKKLGIKNNAQYPKELVRKIKINGLINFAEEKAIILLNIKDYSKQELNLKLTKYVPDKIAIFVVKKMENLGYINDFKYAKNLAKKLIFTKNKGLKLVVYEIVKKGINKNIAEKAIDSLNFNSVEIIKKLILKKYKDKFKDENSKNKIIKKFLSLGHNYLDINLAIKNLKEFKSYNAN